MYAAIAPALACAVVTQVAFLLKHRGARAVRMVRLDRPLQGAKALLASPWFALGMVASGVAWVLHLAALARAPLSMVQAVLASGVTSLPCSAESWSAGASHDGRVRNRPDRPRSRHARPDPPRPDRACRGRPGHALLVRDRDAGAWHDVHARASPRRAGALA
jgi:hypothetical protein